MGAACCHVLGVLSSQMVEAFSFFPHAWLCTLKVELSRVLFRNTTRICKAQRGVGGIVGGERHWTIAISPDMRCCLSPTSLKGMCIKSQRTNRDVSDWWEGRCCHVTLTQHIIHVFKIESLWTTSVGFATKHHSRWVYKNDEKENCIWHWYCELTSTCLKTYRTHKSLQPPHAQILLTSRGDKDFSCSNICELKNYFLELLQL